MPEIEELEADLAEARAKVEQRKPIADSVMPVLAICALLAIFALAGWAAWSSWRVEAWSDMYKEQTKTAEALRAQVEELGAQPVAEPMPQAEGADIPAAVPGAPGVAGPRGPQGEPGEDGKDSTVPGPAGKDGAPGKPGEPGADGETVVGPAGQDGAPGAPGESVVGPKGDTGATGEKGDPGRGITDAVCDQTTGHWTLTWTDGTTTDAGACIHVPAEPVPTTTTAP